MWMWDDNCGSMVSEANALPLEPQPLPWEVALQDEDVGPWTSSVEGVPLLRTCFPDQQRLRILTFFATCVNLFPVLNPGRKFCEAQPKTIFALL